MLKNSGKSFNFYKFLRNCPCDSFSHGAMMLPIQLVQKRLSAIWKSGETLEDSNLGDDFYWILTIGGVGISLGLIAHGYKIIRAIGVKMCKITPSSCRQLN